MHPDNFYIAGVNATFLVTSHDRHRSTRRNKVRRASKPRTPARSGRLRFAQSTPVARNGDAWERLPTFGEFRTIWHMGGCLHMASLKNRVIAEAHADEWSPADDRVETATTHLVLYALRRRLRANRDSPAAPSSDPTAIAPSASAPVSGSLPALTLTV